MDDERWKPIDGFEMYEISDRGRVRNIVTGRLRKVKFDPYPRNFAWVSLRCNGENKCIGIAATVLDVFTGIIAEPLTRSINYKDGNHANCSLSNLEYVERVYSTEEYRARRKNRLERTVARQEQARKVKQLLALGLTQSEIARQTGLTTGMINHIKQGKRYKDVQP